ncbi:MAG: hypothetical protein NT007_14260 [Candidatus Kapabacteria bacterium]|nr:hypothetical protein [Candidatus Kapabacteria bacterium]
MKKFMVLLMFLIFLFISNLYSQCPTLWTIEGPFIVTWAKYPGCSIFFSYQWRLDEGCNLEISDLVYSSHYPCDVVNIDPDAYTYFYQLAANDAMYNHVMGSIPPCGSERGMTLKIFHKKCQTIKNEQYPGGNWVITTYTCSEATGNCWQLYEICIDNTKVPPKVKIIYNSEGADGEVNCNGVYPPVIPPQGKTFYESWTLPCFATPCSNRIF